MDRQHPRIRVWPAVITLVAVLAAITLTPAGAQTTPTLATGRVVGTTNASCYLTVPHTLGTVPSFVGVSIEAPITGTPNLPWQHAEDQFTSSSFRVRLTDTNGTCYSSKRVTLRWVAVAAAAPSSTTGTTQPPTTVRPTTTLPQTTTTLPTTTTAAASR